MAPPLQIAALRYETPAASAHTQPIGSPPKPARLLLRLRFAPL